MTRYGLTPLRSTTLVPADNGPSSNADAALAVVAAGKERRGEPLTESEARALAQFGEPVTHSEDQALTDAQRNEAARFMIERNRIRTGGPHD